MDRLNSLLQFAAEEPDEPFNLYALALEYLKVDTNEALLLFQRLVDRHPEYLPTYYPYAQLLAEKKDRAGAERIFAQGIEVARSKGELKTMRELQSAYQDFTYGA